MNVHFFIRKSNDLLLFVKISPITNSKRFENSACYTSEKELPRSVGSVRGFYCPPTQFSPASVTARRSCLTAEAKFPGKCCS